MLGANKHPEDDNGMTEDEDEEEGEPGHGPAALPRWRLFLFSFFFDVEDSDWAPSNGTQL